MEVPSKNQQRSGTAVPSSLISVCLSVLLPCWYRQGIGKARHESISLLHCYWCPALRAHHHHCCCDLGRAVLHHDPYVPLPASAYAWMIPVPVSLMDRRSLATPEEGVPAAV